MMTAFMNMDYETTKAMMEMSNQLVERFITYVKENREQILRTLASANALNGDYVPAFAR